MTPRTLRELSEHLLRLADETAKQNGYSRSTEFGELRFRAGTANGLRQAASEVLTVMTEKEDDSSE